jgi:hypothetical protein
MPSTKQFEHFEVEDLYYEWIDSLTEQVPIVPLAKISKRIQTDEPAQPSACQSPNAADGVECKPTESESESSAEGRNWSLAQVQQLIGEFARIEGMSSEQFARAAESRWRAGLQDQRIRLRQRRAEVRRTIKQLEQQKQDLLLEKSSPDPQRIELINRYVTAVAKQREKSLKTLHELQRSRRKNGRRTQSSE